MATIKYRKLDDNDDYTFGRGDVKNFHTDTAEAVAQSIKTRLLLWVGEWFLDTTAGTPYKTQVLGYNTKNLYDTAIKERILDTTGVASLDSFDSSIDADTRAATTTATVTTDFGDSVTVTV